MPRPQLHAFEGEQLTVRQIHQRVPVLSERTIRDHLAAGRRTRTAMLCFDPVAAAARGGRITQRLLRARGAGGRDSWPIAGCHLLPGVDSA